MTKQLLTILMLFLINVAGMADTFLHISFLSNDSWEIALEENPTVTFENNMMKITTQSQSVKFKRADISVFYFKNKQSGITDITTIPIEIEWLNNRSISIKGLTDHNDIHLFDLQGLQHNIDYVDNGDSGIINLHKLDSGIYILRIKDNKTIKLKLK